jgi:hypothetical protein
MKEVKFIECNYITEYAPFFGKSGIIILRKIEDGRITGTILMSYRIGLGD